MWKRTLATWESAVSNCERRAWKHLGYQTMLLEEGSGRGEDFLQVGRCKWCFVFFKAITSLSNWVATRGLIGRNLCFDENMWPSRFGRIFDYLKTTTNDFFLVYIYDELSSLCKKNVSYRPKKRNIQSHMQLKKKDEKVLQRKNWCMRIFCSIECKLIGFQQTFVLSCAAQPTWSLWIFNGDLFLPDTEKAHIHPLFQIPRVSYCLSQRATVFFGFFSF